MKIKPINKLNDAELLEKFKSSKSTLSNKVANVGFFISHYNIRKGNYLVGIQLLYRLYKSWTGTSLKYSTFKNELKQYFLIYKDHYVHISLDAIQVTKETMSFLLAEQHAPAMKSNKTIKNFIEYNNLEEGKVWVSAMLLYKVCIFQTRLMKNSNPKVSIIEFVNYLKLYFPYIFTRLHLFRITEVNYELLKKEEERLLIWQKEQKSKNTVRRAKTRIKLKNTV